jgi:hypothetical protein
VREVFGPSPTKAQIASVRLDVLGALVQIRAAALASQPLPRLIRGRALADWLPARAVAELLHELAGVTGTVTVSAGLWPDELPGLGRRTVGPYERCAYGMAGTFVRYGNTPLCRRCALVLPRSEQVISNADHGRLADNHSESHEDNDR